MIIKNSLHTQIKRATVQRATGSSKKGHMFNISFYYLVFSLDITVLCYKREKIKASHISPLPDLLIISMISLLFCSITEQLRLQGT